MTTFMKQTLINHTNLTRIKVESNISEEKTVQEIVYILSYHLRVKEPNNLGGKVEHSEQKETEMTI